MKQITIPKEVSKFRAWEANANPHINMAKDMAMEMNGAIAGALKRTLSRSRDIPPFFG
jgi:hypothetical protein